MKKYILKLAVVALCALCVSNARAAVVALWSYSSGASTSVDSLNTGVSSATATISGNGNNASVPTSGGVTTGYYLDTVAGNKIGNGTFTIVITAATGYTISLTSLQFSFNTFSDSAPPTSITWAYATTGTAGSGGSSSTLGATSGNWSAGSDTLSYTLTGGKTLTITGSLVGTGNGSDTSNIGFDNITLNGTVVPETTNYALIGFGLIFIGGAAGRHYLARRRQA